MNEEDRELHELAARAAGVELEPGTTRLKGKMQVWRPRENDGDAMRLAIKLHIDLDSEDLFEMVACTYRGTHIEHIGRVRAASDHDADRCAAMREAIFNVAVAIGKGMP